MYFLQIGNDYIDNVALYIRSGQTSLDFRK